MVMLLSDRDIRVELGACRLVIEPPPDPGQIQPASIDLRLGDQVIEFHHRPFGVIDPAVDQRDRGTPIDLGSCPFLLRPGVFALGATMETVILPDDLAARIEGKSSLGRLGLMVHSTAGFIDPGFEGQLTLELSNVSPTPIVLRPTMRIGQLCLFRLSSPAERPYGTPGLGSRYQGQTGPTMSRSHLGGPPAPPIVAAMDQITH
jgi:dCTP deaminase